MKFSLVDTYLELENEAGLDTQSTDASVRGEGEGLVEDVTDVPEGQQQQVQQRGAQRHCTLASFLLLFLPDGRRPDHHHRDHRPHPAGVHRVLPLPEVLQDQGGQTDQVRKEEANNHLYDAIPPCRSNSGKEYTPAATNDPNAV